MSPTLIALEQAFADQLPARRLMGRPSCALLDAAGQWAVAVWDLAVTRGPLPLDAGTIAAGLALAARPVFVCGVHRSGTTLVQQLLDGHPALAVLPAEGDGLQAFGARLEGAARATGTEWVRRLANPSNRPPFWVLGRTTPDGSPYVECARAVLAWWPIVAARMPSVCSSRPLLVAALAYATVTGRFPGDGTAMRWVDKTPGNERSIDRLRGEFPDAVFVHVIRHPLDVLASRKRLEIDVHGAFRGRRRIIGELVGSLRVAVDRHARAARDASYVLVKYEALVNDPRGTVERLAGTLGVAFTGTLLEPTVAGQPASANSSWDADARPGAIVPVATHRGDLTWSERAIVVAAAGRDARALGYDVPAVWRRSQV